MRCGAVALTLALLGGASLPAHAAISPQAAAAGDAVVEAAIGEPRTLVPILASDSASGAIVGLVFNGLVKYDPQLRLVGDLADHWEILDGGLAIVFHLRRHVRWHDGSPFTAADVRFTYEALMDPAVPTPYRSDFERVKTLDILDPWTIKVTYQEPHAPALASWGMAMMPKHLLAGHDLRTTPWARQPVGTGPFRFVRWVTADRIELAANPDYFEHPPHLKGWFYRIIPDQGTIFLELRTEGVDLAGLTPLQYRRQLDGPVLRERYRTFRLPSWGYTYLGYNLALPMFRDVRVRQAINLAINKEAIIQGALMGLGRVATGPFLPESWAYDPALASAPYHPSRATALLAEAGWADHDGDGWLDRDGQPFRFTILTNQGNLPRELTAQIVQQQLRAVGIDVQIRIIEWSSFVTQFLMTRRFEAVLLGWGLSPEPDPYDIWHSSKTGEGEFNVVGYSNPVVDRLLEAGRRTFDLAERTTIYHELQRILYEEQPYCFLYVPDALPILHARFRGVEPTPIGLQHHVIDWSVPPREQRYDF